MQFEHMMSWASDFDNMNDSFNEHKLLVHISLTNSHNLFWKQSRVYFISTIQFQTAEDT